MSDIIKDMIESPHPIYRRYNAYWHFLLQSYEGGVDYSNSMVLNSNQQQGILDAMFKYFVNGIQQQNQTVYGNLFMHPKERVEDYNRRVNMSYYYNFCAPIIDIYGDHLFKQPVIEDYEEIEDTIEQVKDNIDRQGSNIQEFRKNMSDMAQVYGHCFVIIDSPNISGTQVLTRKDQIDLNAFPYLTLYAPTKIKNWACDEFGNAYWVLVEESYESNKDPMAFSKDKVNSCYYRLWTREEWFLYDEEYSLIQKGTHGLGIVPIVCVFDKKSKKARNFLGISSIADIAFIARDIYNASSELRQILRDQTFAFLALQGTSDEYSAVDLGTGKGILYPENRNAPQYVSPPSDNARTYFDHIDRQVTKIFQLAKLEGGSANKNGQEATMQSGVSKAWDFNQTNSSLSSKSSNLEDAEMRIWQIFARWEGKEFTGSVQYPNEFSITSLMEDLTEAEKMARLELGKTADIEVKKAILTKKFPRKSQEDIEEMVGELEEMADKKDSVGSIVDRIRMLSNKDTATGGEKQGESNE